MNYDKAMNMDKVEFGNMPPQAFLHGTTDKNMTVTTSTYSDEEYTAYFSRHINSTQPWYIFNNNKLEKKGLIEMGTDGKDRRKQRVLLTEQCEEYCERNDAQSREIISRIFDGVGEKDLAVTIETIIKMERNVSKL